MNCSLGAAAGMALLAGAALAEEPQPVTDLDKIIEIAIASIGTRSATSYEVTARDRTQLRPGSSANWIMVAVVGPVGNAQRCPRGGLVGHAAMRRASFLCSRRSSMFR
jgi:hypothetical protein